MPSPHLVSALVDTIARENALQVPFLQSSLQEILAEELDELEAYLQFCQGQGLELGYLGRCYNTIVRDTLREQVFFQRYGRYRYHTYAEVANSVYLNDEYMHLYMYGLALTTYLWPNHRRIRRFFVEVLPRTSRGRYLEVGPGHGVFFLAALRLASFATFEGVDISPTSCAMTESIVASGYFGKFANVRISCKDFLSDDVGKASYAAIVMGEVLEHVEQPLRFLEKVQVACEVGGFAFVTTAINAPAVDHIFLYESPSAVTDMVNRAGLRIQAQLVVPYAGLSLEESLRTRMPVNIALALST